MIFYYVFPFFYEVFLSTSHWYLRTVDFVVIVFFCFEKNLPQLISSADRISIGITSSGVTIELSQGRSVITQVWSAIGVFCNFIWSVCHHTGCLRKIFFYNLDFNFFLVQVQVSNRKVMIRNQYQVFHFFVLFSVFLLSFKRCSQNIVIDKRQ